MMEKLEIFRASAYEHLQRLIKKYNKKNRSVYLRDYEIVMNVLHDFGEDYSHATVIEKQAAKVLNLILEMQATNETGVAAKAYVGDAETLETILNKELVVNIDLLEKVKKGIPIEVTTSILLEEERKPLRREMQLKLISAQIDSLGYDDPLSLPDRAKSRLREKCISLDIGLFQGSSFDHAWKEGIKLKLFRMKNSDKFSKGR
jgi:hypothetical protein